jgi:hypothetical protein
VFQFGGEAGLESAELGHREGGKVDWFRGVVSLDCSLYKVGEQHSRMYRELRSYLSLGELLLTKGSLLVALWNCRKVKGYRLVSR